ncbi:MAG: hypothetical protein MRZ16_02230 [Parvimonas sp.]|uniref:hypothetical protein n=1 Tax=Parvimonas sp. TaxID=1944660 RepID=UPI00260015BD|nr:hypothetical protein [Parvimonas sp.]MCI5997037.1 hypothetical protein [Parvimonas sp.]
MKLKCKKCGNTELFYEKEKYKGTCNYVVDNEGNATDYNLGMYDHAEHTLNSVWYYCCECDSKVYKIPVDKRF